MCRRGIVTGGGAGGGEEADFGKPVATAAHEGLAATLNVTGI
jgi:hypothetical protein